MSPRSGPGGPKSGPRGPKTAPPQEPPGAPQEAPKSSQERPRRAPKGLQESSWAPKVRQEPFGSSFWPHFGGALGLIFKQLRRPFRSSRALRQTIENTLRNHWSKGLVLVWPAFGGRKRNHNEEFIRFSDQDFLVYESNCPPRRVFSHVGPQKPRVFTWFRDFHAFLRPPVAPRGQRSHENAVRNHLSKGPSRQLRDRSKQGPWLGGRVLGAHAPLEIRPLSLTGSRGGRGAKRIEGVGCC